MSFRRKLAGELKRIEGEEQKKPKDRKKGVLSEIDAFLDRLEMDITEEEETYRVSIRIETEGASDLQLEQSASQNSMGWRSVQLNNELDKKTKNPLCVVQSRLICERSTVANSSS